MDLTHVARVGVDLTHLVRVEDQQPPVVKKVVSLLAA